MRKVGLFEAKQKLSELVERASGGERIGVTRRGKLAAVIVSARPDSTPQAIFDEIEDIRKRAARRTKKPNVKRLIEEGRE